MSGQYFVDGFSIEPEYSLDDYSISRVGMFIDSVGNIHMKNDKGEWEKQETK